MYALSKYIEEAIEECVESGSGIRTLEGSVGNEPLTIKAEWCPHVDGVSDVVIVYILRDRGSVMFRYVIEETKVCR